MWFTFKLLFALSLAANVTAFVLGVDFAEWLWGVSALLGVQCYRQWTAVIDGGTRRDQRRRRGFGGKPPRYHFR